MNLPVVLKGSDKEFQNSIEVDFNLSPNDLPYFVSVDEENSSKYILTFNYVLNEHDRDMKNFKINDHESILFSEETGRIYKLELNRNEIQKERELKDFFKDLIKEYIKGPQRKLSNVKQGKSILFSALKILKEDFTFLPEPNLKQL